jgi:hypothetical protein
MDANGFKGNIWTMRKLSPELFQRIYFLEVNGLKAWHLLLCEVQAELLFINYHNAGCSPEERAMRSQNTHCIQGHLQNMMLQKWSQHRA